MFKPGLAYAKRRFVDVENRGRGAFAINKGLKATQAVTTAAIFNPEELAKMILDEVKLYLQELVNFYFVTKEITDMQLWKQILW